MYYKINDTVTVLVGKDKGKTGKITQMLPDDHMVIVDGVNKMYKNIRSQKRGEKGQRVEFSAPLLMDKVMLVCSKCKKASRMNVKRDGKKRSRVCKKCKETID